MRTIRIATRSSELALWQARHVASLFSGAASRVEVVLVPVESEGDQDVKTPLSALGGVGVFTRSVQQALLDGRADLAVHSAKDLPTRGVPGLVLAAVPARGPREDVLVAGGRRLADLPPGSRVGTSSPRRRAFLATRRPDLVYGELRGNVPTRLAKRDAGEHDAIVLARAGLVRLGLERRIDEVLGPDLVLPAVGQGALAVECRDDDDLARRTLASIESPADRLAVDAERAFLAALEGGCHLPAGIWSSREGDRLHLEGGVARPDGSLEIRRRVEGPAASPVDLGRRLADEILAAGGGAIVSTWR